MNQVLELASKPLLQTGQARLGAFISFYRILAFEPYAPVGQADWGQADWGQAGLGASRTGDKPTGDKPTGGRVDWGRVDWGRVDWGRSRSALAILLHAACDWR